VPDLTKRGGAVIALKAGGRAFRTEWSERTYWVDASEPAENGGERHWAAGYVYNSGGGIWVVRDTEGELVVSRTDQATTRAEAVIAAETRVRRPSDSRQP
jgi:hypothetical protein